MAETRKDSLFLGLTTRSISPGLMAMTFGFAGVAKIDPSRANRFKNLHAIAGLNGIRAHRFGLAFSGISCFCCR